MIITTAHAKQLGWQHVEFDDGLGFRPCTSVCAWNPEFRYRAKHKFDKHADLRSQYNEQYAKGTLIHHTWFVKCPQLTGFAKCGGQPLFVEELDYCFEHTHCLVQGPSDKGPVRMTLEEAKVLYKDGKTSGWLTPTGMRLSDVPHFTMFGVYSYQRDNTLAKTPSKTFDLDGNLVDRQRLTKKGIKAFEARIKELEDQLSEASKNALRYQVVRSRHWSESDFCVVLDPKKSVKLGGTCPSGKELDGLVDKFIESRRKT